MPELPARLEVLPTNSNSRESSRTPLQDEANKLRLPFEFPKTNTNPFTIDPSQTDNNSAAQEKVKTAATQSSPTFQLTEAQRVQAVNNYADNLLTTRAFADADRNENYFLSKRELEQAATEGSGSMPKDVASYFNHNYSAIRDLYTDRHYGRGGNPYPVPYNSLGVSTNDVHALWVSTLPDGNQRSSEINGMTLGDNRSMGIMVLGGSFGLVGTGLGWAAKGWRGAAVGAGLTALGIGAGLWTVRNSITGELDAMRANIRRDTFIDELESKKR